MKLLGISIVIALSAVTGCKKKPATTSAGSDSPGSGSSMTGSSTGSGSSSAAGSAIGSGSDSGSAAGSGSAAATGSGSAAGPSAAIKLDPLPAGWDRTDDPDVGKLEYVAAVNDSKFPVDNAQFGFIFAEVTGKGAPTEPAKFGEWFALEMKTKLDKTEKLGDGADGAIVYEFAGAKQGDETFTVVKKVGAKLWACGGLLYRDADYNKIPKVRDEVIATAKKLCASMK